MDIWYGVDTTAPGRRADSEAATAAFMEPAAGPHCFGRADPRGRQSAAVRHGVYSLTPWNRRCFDRLGSWTCLDRDDHRCGHHLFLQPALPFPSTIGSPNRLEPWTTPPLPPTPRRSWLGWLRWLMLDLGKTLFVLPLSVMVFLISWIPGLNLLGLLGTADY